MTSITTKLIAALLAAKDSETIEIQLTGDEDTELASPIIFYNYEAGDCPLEAAAAVLSVVLGRKITFLEPAEASSTFDVDKKPEKISSRITETGMIFYSEKTPQQMRLTGRSGPNGIRYPDQEWWVFPEDWTPEQITEWERLHPLGQANDCAGPDAD